MKMLRCQKCCHGCISKRRPYSGYTIRQLPRVTISIRKTTQRNIKSAYSLQEVFPRTDYECKLILIAEMLHNNVQLIRLKDVVGHTAVEGALPYPPGISVLSLVKMVRDSSKVFHDFAEGNQCLSRICSLKFKVYFKKENGKTVAYCEVLDDKTEAKQR